MICGGIGGIKKKRLGKTYRSDEDSRSKEVKAPPLYVVYYEGNFSFPRAITPPPILDFLAAHLTSLLCPITRTVCQMRIQDRCCSSVWFHTASEYRYIPRFDSQLHM